MELEMIKHIGSPNPRYLAEVLMNLSRKRSTITTITITNTAPSPQVREEASRHEQAERWRTGSSAVAAFAEFGD